MTGRLDAAFRGMTAATGLFAAGLAVLGLALPGGTKRPDLPPSAPISVRASAIHLAAHVVPIPLVDGVLTPPSDVTEVGWWDGSALPGSHHGRVVLTGHTVHTGGGVLNRLPTVRRGQRVRVSTKRGTIVYEIRSVRALNHEQLAHRARSLFGQRDGHGQLVLVTCSQWDGVTYQRNTVVTADPVKEERARRAAVTRS